LPVTLRSAQTSSVAERRDQDQGFHGSLAFGCHVLSFRQLGYEVGRVLQRDELLSAGQIDRFVKFARLFFFSHQQPSSKLYYIG
jgi:hypothetical protein